MARKSQLIAAPWYLVFDLEATCDDGDPPVFPREEMEIIEIGAAMVSGESFEPVDEFQSFVQPVRNPVLTDFCRGLTTINQEQVDAAPRFPEVWAAFQAWAAKYPGCCWMSWGRYDENQIRKDARFWDLQLPGGFGVFNLKAGFAKQRGIKRCGIPAALSILGLPPMTGTHHRGIDDARNIVRILKGMQA